jgi:hypothetical protein
MYDQLKTARLVFTVFASLLVSSVTIAAAIGPAHPVVAQFA